MKKSYQYLLVFLFFSCAYTSSKKEDRSKFTVNIVSHAPISSEEKIKIKERIKQTASKIGKEFNLSESEVFNVHIWKNYPDFLLEQEKNIGVKYEGSGGYIFGNNNLAIFYDSRLLENAAHEFVHAASLHLNHEFANNPRWFWESVAIYESGSFMHPKEITYLKNGEFPSLFELNNMISKEGPNKVYQVGYLLSEFIIEKWGRKTYIQLIKESGNIKKTLSISEQEFEEEWKQFVNTKYFTKM